MKVTALLKRAVWTARERRPTAPVRIGVGLALAAVTLLFVQVAAVGLVGVGGGEGGVLAGVVALLAYGALGVALVFAGVAVDRRTLADMGFGIDRDWWLDLGFGLALGAGLMTGIFLLSLAAGWARVTGTFVADSGGVLSGFGPKFAFALALFVLVGFQEELALRGWFLTNLAEGFDGFGPVGRTGAVGIAVAVSSVVFGLLHLGNPNATAVSALGITLAGVMLAAGYVLTGDLAIPVGVHITWNLFQGPVYGFAVSGLDLGVRVVALSVSGPELVTGGRFGPEAGLLGIGGVVAGTLLTAWWVRYRTGRLAVVDGLTVPDLRWRRGGPTDADAAGPPEESPTATEEP